MIKVEDTEVYGFEAWGIDVKRLEKGLGILEKLGLEVKTNEGI